jgi:Cdc6-like AAA superfamily ATPase
MLWTEGSLKKLAANEATAMLKSEGGRSAVRDHFLSLLPETQMLAALKAAFILVLNEEEAKPIAEQVTSEVRALLQHLDGQIERAIKVERKKVAEQKAEMLEKMKEELRASIIAHKALTTRQVNQHIEQHQDLVRNRLAGMKACVAEMEAQLMEATEEAMGNIASKQASSLAKLKVGIDRVLEDKLETFAAQAVKKHLQKRPISSPRYTNRELAQINGISIRQVKRRRKVKI